MAGAAARRSARVGVPIAEASRRLHQLRSQMWPTEIDRSASTTITANATPHAVGSWTQLVASTAARTDFVVVSAFNMASSTAATEAMIDIGVGGSGSEVAKVSNVPVGYCSSDAVIRLLPVRISRGSRVSARLQAVVSADTCDLIVSFMNVQIGQAGSDRMVPIGANAAASRGTPVTSSATWVQVTAATTEPFAGLVLMPLIAGSGSLSSDVGYLVELGLGGSGSEVSVARVYHTTTTAELLRSFTNADSLGYYAGHVPAGTRVAARANIARAYLDVIVFGVPYQ